MHSEHVNMMVLKIYQENLGKTLSYVWLFDKKTEPTNLINQYMIQVNCMVSYEYNILFNNLNYDLFFGYHLIRINRFSYQTQSTAFEIRQFYAFKVQIGHYI